MSTKANIQIFFFLIFFSLVHTVKNDLPTVGIIGKLLLFSGWWDGPKCVLVGLICILAFIPPFPIVNSLTHTKNTYSIAYKNYVMCFKIHLISSQTPPNQKKRLQRPRTPSCNIQLQYSADTIIQITKLIKGVADPLFGKTFKTNANHNTPTPPYYTDECEYKRKIFLDALNVFRRDSSDTNGQTMVDARSGFKNLARKCRREHDANQTEKLRRAKLDNANDDWK